jgi:hypothetical protein
MNADQWAKYLLSKKARSYFFNPDSGIHKPKHKPSPGDTSAAARGQSRLQ